METDMINGFTQATLSLSHNSVYNLMATDSNQTFSAHLHITNHGTSGLCYTKSCNIGYSGEFKEKKTFFKLLNHIGVRIQILT